MELQTYLREVDWVLARLGVAGLKGTVGKYSEYGGGRSKRLLGSVQASAFDGDSGDVLKRIVEYENSV